MISIRMLKLCGTPLVLIFKSCLESGTFPSEWKKGNVVPKQSSKNYGPISLLSIYEKISE